MDRNLTRNRKNPDKAVQGPNICLKSIELRIFQCCSTVLRLKKQQQMEVKKMEDERKGRSDER
eukprot:763778-Hanusia_phi.AAC.24